MLFRPHPEVCLRRGGGYTCQTSVLDRKQRSKEGSTLQWGVARHRQWTEKVQVRSQVSSVYPNVVGTWPCVSGYEMFSSKSLFYCLFFVLILRIIFLLQLDISLCDLLQTNYSTLAIFHGFNLVP